MTVKDLIIKLFELNPDLPIFILCPDESLEEPKLEVLTESCSNPETVGYFLR